MPSSFSFDIDNFGDYLAYKLSEFMGIGIKYVKNDRKAILFEFMTCDGGKLLKMNNTISESMKLYVAKSMDPVLNVIAAEVIEKMSFQELTRLYNVDLDIDEVKPEGKKFVLDSLGGLDGCDGDEVVILQKKTKEIIKELVIDKEAEKSDTINLEDHKILNYKKLLDIGDSYDKWLEQYADDRW